VTTWGNTTDGLATGAGWASRTEFPQLGHNVTPFAGTVIPCPHWGQGPLTGPAETICPGIGPIVAQPPTAKTIANIMSACFISNLLPPKADFTSNLHQPSTYYYSK